MSSAPAVAVTPVTLEALLAARDRRAERQRLWLERWQETLVSLTLVWPGEVKDSPQARQVMQVALMAFGELVQGAGWGICQHQVFWLHEGAEAFWAITAPAAAVKRATVALENQHPLGRLWDMDVFSPRDGLLSRSSCGQPARTCLVCDEPAHACARSGKHPLSRLLQSIEDKIDDYVNSSSV
ncbi:citrate lyase holo-[acyl-carrier protein] synthase [Serratia fonticola]|uniref:citrate lyase holo-[acyl-carrier protein] synthase n=1 Tax=Serratia fonticola TaxID=47917 RepID=UPI0034C60212